MATAFWVSRAVYSAARLELADRMAEGMHEVSELAKATGTHGPSLRRLLRTLTGLGLVTQVGEHRFALTSLGDVLRADAPGAVRGTVLSLGGDWDWRTFGECMHSLRTGEPSFDKALGMPFFPYLAQNREEGHEFNTAMQGFFDHEPPLIAEAHDFSQFRTLVDVGGGSGNLLTSLLAANPGTKGLLYDQPHVAEDARRLIAARSLAHRCEFQAGDFFECVPSGGDAYLLSHIVHDWELSKCLKLLGNCREAIPAHGRLYLIDGVLPEGDAPHPGKVLDWVMLNVTGGMERTEKEYAELLHQASFELTRVISTRSSSSLVEARPI
ncbi:O-methyltransferase [Myxococcus fulvus 124B02]|nr:O-methyltransferase [Myxococcus fulvus 124B02]